MESFSLYSIYCHNALFYRTLPLSSPLSLSLATNFRTPMTRLSEIFPSRKIPRPIQSKPSSSSSSSPITPIDDINSKQKEKSLALASSSSLPPKSEIKRRRASQWSVYLIISARLPKTYVGVTTNFSRRLKQHNGELKGGAKASSAGRPWILACIIGGFKDQSEACELEYKWKSISRKMPRKRSKDHQASNLLLQHREAALSKAKSLLDYGNLQIDWHLSTS